MSVKEWWTSRSGMGWMCGWWRSGGELVGEEVDFVVCVCIIILIRRIRSQLAVLCIILCYTLYFVLCLPVLFCAFYFDINIHPWMAL